jgi:amino acid adenylation domain-containing protein/non-ribosomal peptide synthase protein (TIGR01720 family)
MSNQKLVSIEHRVNSVSRRETIKSILLVKAPYFTPWTPPLGIATLKSFLQQKGYTAQCIDYNIDPELWGMHHAYFAALQKLESVSINDGYSKLWWILNSHLIAYANGAERASCVRVVETIAPMYGVRLSRDTINTVLSLVEKFFMRLDQLVESLNLDNFSVVGTSTYTTSLAASLFMLRKVKQKCPHITTIMGGGVFADDLALGSDNLETLVREYDFVDHVILGEGELLLLKFLEGEFANRRVVSIADLKGMTLNMRDVPSPDFSDLDLDNYFHLTIEGARSCPFQCSFCSETIQWGEYRKKPIELFVQQVIGLSQKYQNNFFFMGDSLMNPYIIQFSEELIRTNARIFYDGYLRADKPVTNRGRVKQWARSGCFRVRLGIESASARVLATMDKKTNPGVISEVLKSLASAGIRTTTYWIVGFPGETEEDFQETLDFIREHHRYIYELEAHPYYYYPYGQVGSRLYTCHSLYPDEINEITRFKVWEVDGISPTREIRFERLRRISKLASDLGLPNIYSMAERFAAEDRWARLCPLASQVYEDTGFYREKASPSLYPLEIFVNEAGLLSRLDILIYQVVVSKPLDKATLVASVERLIDFNEILQMSLQGGKYVSVATLEDCSREVPVYEYDFYDDPEHSDSVITDVLIRASTGMHAERAASVRVAFTSNKDGSSNVFLLVHRAIADAKGVVLLFEDLVRIYEQLSNEVEISLRPFEKSYSDFILEFDDHGHFDKSVVLQERHFATEVYDTIDDSAWRRNEADDKQINSLELFLDKTTTNRIFAGSVIESGWKPAEVFIAACLASLQACQMDDIGIDIRDDYRSTSPSLAETIGALTRIKRVSSAALINSLFKPVERRGPRAPHVAKSSPTIDRPPLAQATRQTMLLDPEYLVDEPWLGGDKWKAIGFVVEKITMAPDYIVELAPVRSGGEIRVCLKYRDTIEAKRLVEAIEKHLVAELLSLLDNPAEYITTKQIILSESDLEVSEPTPDPKRLPSRILPEENRASATSESRQSQPEKPQSPGADSDDLSKEVADLSPDQQALLMLMLRKKAATRDIQSNIVKEIKPISQDGDLPLSYAQHRLWVVDQLAPGGFAYNLSVAICLTGQLNAVALEQGISEIVRRHKVLRTTFEAAGEQARQIIHQAHPVEMLVVDLSGLSETTLGEEDKQLAKSESSRPFDLARGPLLRITLLRLQDEEYAVLFTMHHIVSDGWSMGVLVREFIALYTAYCMGVPSPLPELPIQYVDFASWQRQWLEGKVLEEEMAYWKRQLSGASSVLTLPTDRLRTAMQKFHGAQELVHLSSDLKEALVALSGRASVTLFMTLLTAFKILLYRYIAEEDLVVGTVVANRTQSKLEGLIGFFVNMLVLRTHCSGDLRFEGLLQLVREVTLEAYMHQEAPFDKLVDELQPMRDPSHAPLFQLVFNLNNQPVSALELPGLKVSFLNVGLSELMDATVRYDLVLSLTESEQVLQGVLEFNSDLFDRTTIKRFKQQFYTLLEGILADPKRRVSEYSLLTDREQHHLLIEFNGPDTEFIVEKCVHRVFEQQVERTPDAIAVICGERILSYAELNRRANQLAHHLRWFGVRQESIVGACLDRSLEVIVALLGVIKAGGVWLPLNPDSPAERLVAMLEDADARVLLTQQTVEDWAGRIEIHGHRIVNTVRLDADWKRIALGDEFNPTSDIDARHLAYMIYTSGSTGRPKGVQVEHGTLSNHCCAIQHHYRLAQSDRVLQFASLNFDPSIEQILPTLMTGARIVLREGNALPAAEFNRMVAMQELTVVNIPPAYWHQWTQWMVQKGGNADDAAEMPTQLRLVVIGGDTMLPETLSMWQQTPLHAARLLNAYGPTETTITATTSEVSPRDGVAPLIRLPIGRPLANRTAYLLDADQQPVPISVVGELYLGSAGLARGYLNHSELTAEKFVPDIFSNLPGVRMYRTGDLARFITDGEIEFLGRVDLQVKIRGCRVELQEIEAALSRSPGIRQALVIAHEVLPDNPRLIAYVVPQQDVQLAKHETASTVYDFPTLSLKAMRSYLNGCLPTYMIPSAFVILDELPLSSTGKVDRRRLPIPVETDLESQVSIAAPRTLVEETLVGIWSKVLGVNQVGVYDNFFELGGDSILAIQIGARANQAGLQLTPNQIFQYQTIAGLSRIVKPIQESAESEQSLVTGPVPLTPIQQWFFEQNLPEPSHFNQAVLLEVRTRLDPVILERVVAQLLLHHDSLRLRFTRAESEWKQFNTGRNDTVPFTYLDLSLLPKSERVVALEATISSLQLGLNLSDGPMLRVALFHLDDESPGRLLLVIHHLVFDGVSGRILLEDLQTGYEQLARGETIEFPAKTGSYQRWANRLLQYAESSELQKELDYWLTDDRRQFCHLPIDYPEGNNIMKSADIVVVELCAEETKSLLQQVPKAYQTQIIDVLLAAVVKAFSESTGNNSLLIDLEGHGREKLFDDLDISRTIGWFTTIFPVLLEFRDGCDPGAALKSIKERLRSVPKRGTGYGILRYLSREIEAAQKLRELPQAEVIFNYLGQMDQVLAETGLFSPALESCGPTGSPLRKRNYLIEINGGVAAGRMQFHWRYSENIHRRVTIESLAQCFIQSLQELIAHCLSPSAGGYTPSDFPLAALDQDELDKVLAKAEYLRDIRDIYPLSPLQEGLLFHSLYAPDSGVYITQVICTLEQLNASAFRRAWQKVVDRHSIFRTAFVWEGLKRALQVVYRELEVPFELEDLRHLSRPAQEARLQVYLQEDRSRGFEISQPFLMRLMLFRVADNIYKFIWTSHHTLLDGWSTVKVIEEITKFYDEICRNQFIVLEQPSPYRNYIAWLRQQDLSAAESYWRPLLKGFTTPTSVGREQALQRLPGREQSYSEQEIVVSEGATSALGSLTREEHLTLNTLVMGAWAILLSRYSGEQDVLFGNIISCRPPEVIGIESMVGLFINTLPVRIQLSPELFLSEWLKQLQSQQAKARQYEYTPLIQTQLWSDLSSGAPLFECTYCFQNYPLTTSVNEQKSLLRITDIQLIEQQHYPLRLNVAPGANLLLSIAYENPRFDDRTITRMLTHLRVILEEIAKNLGQQIGNLTLLTQEERQQTLVSWNETSAEYPRQQCIYELFEEQVERTPEVVAVSCDEQYLTFQELNGRANQLAHYLRGKGVGPAVLVGVFMEHSLDEVVTLIGALKAGVGYVPLDPDIPSERLTMMIEDAHLAIVLTQQHLVGTLPSSWAQVACVDSDWGTIQQYSYGNVDSGATPDNIAYVIYTSGSTGRPKGVLIPHSGLVNYIWWAKDLYLRGDQIAVSLYSSLAFDLTVTSIYAPLITGNTIVVQPRQGKDVSLIDILSSGKVGMLKLTPSHLSMITQRDNRQSSVKRLIVGGEAFEAKLAREVYESFGGEVEIYNEYGPTEATVGCMIYRYDAARQEGTSVPIGRAAANTQIYVLDEWMNPVAQGTAGEVYIGGEGIGQGYLGHAELTAERFVANPFGNGQRMYRTGDLARSRFDGALEFLDRIDHQVKVRGFRIELGEIEAALRQYPTLREAVVLAPKDKSGNVRLVAYFVPTEETKIDLESLRGFLQKKLPDNMVPSVFVKLAALPLTPSGKIDRHALPEPEGGRPELTAIYIAPQTRLEQTIASVWREVLSLDKVGLQDNFFDLGGHSLLLIQVNSELERLLGRQLSPVDLFEYPTVGSLAKFLSDQPETTQSGDQSEQRERGKGRLKQRLRQRQEAR